MVSRNKINEIFFLVERKKEREEKLAICRNQLEIKDQFIMVKNNREQAKQ